MVDKILLSIPEAQHALGDVGRSTLYGLMHKGVLERKSIGRRTFVTSSSVSRYVAGLDYDPPEMPSRRKAG